MDICELVFREMLRKTVDEVEIEVQNTAGTKHLTSLSCVVAVQIDQNAEAIDVTMVLVFYAQLTRQATLSYLSSGTFIITAGL